MGRGRDRLFVIGVSARCNNNCLFCMEKRIRDVRVYSQNELEEAAKKFSRVDLTVGEPTVNPKLVDYVIMAKKAGFRKIEITTNGRMLAVPGYAEKLANAGITRFKISIHGSNARVHDALTRTPGSFEQSIRGLGNVSKLKHRYGLTIDALMTVTKLNYKDIPEALDLFLEYPIDNIIFNIFDIMKRARKVAKILTPRYSDVEKVFHKAIKGRESLLKQKGTKVTISLPLCILRDDIKEYYGNYEILISRHDITPNKDLIRRGKTFVDACNECELSEMCDGVWPDYLKIFGDSEFRAQKGALKLLKKGYPDGSGETLSNPKSLT